MKSIVIKGTFNAPKNNLVILDVFRPNSSKNPYDFRKAFTDDFTETISDLNDNTTYNIDLAGFTMNELNITISGEFSAEEIKEHFEKTDFTVGYAIRTIK